MEPKAVVVRAVVGRIFVPAHQLSVDRMRIAAAILKVTLGSRRRFRVLCAPVTETGNAL